MNDVCHGEGCAHCERLMNADPVEMLMLEVAIAVTLGEAGYTPNWCALREALEALNEARAEARQP